MQMSYRIHQGKVIELDDIDALPDTPVLDLKNWTLISRSPYFGRSKGWARHPKTGEMR
jgi:tRNA (Thr-GGU) A37 N-methylase